MREARTSRRLTQARAAAMLGVSLRSYKTYETDPAKADTLKYRYLTRRMQELTRVDETHGVLSLGEIRTACAAVL